MSVHRIHSWNYPTLSVLNISTHISRVSGELMWGSPYMRAADYFSDRRLGDRP